MLKAPFPYFGGKSKIASLVWQKLGKVSNYVEPFAGSLAVLLANPNPAKIETVNDKDYLIVNFWRAVSFAAEEVAKFADYPVTEADLHARHRWILSQINDDFKNKMDQDPHYFDAKIAGWWVWGIGASIGNNWLQPKGLKAIPILSSAGGGIHGMTYQVSDWMQQLQKRLKRVRVCCGDWKKVVSPSVTFKNKGISEKDITAVFLDPPYYSQNRDKVYQEDSNIYSEVCQWAVDNQNKNLKIVVCGYDNDYQFPESWEKVKWKANGGLGNLGNSRGKENSNRECIYFSPSCL